jgi:hypothetical protein
MVRPVTVPDVYTKEVETATRIMRKVTMDTKMDRHRKEDLLVYLQKAIQVLMDHNNDQAKKGNIHGG